MLGRHGVMTAGAGQSPAEDVQHARSLYGSISCMPASESWTVQPFQDGRNMIASRERAANA